MKHRGILIVVSGFSGAGKGTLMKKLMETYDNYAGREKQTEKSTFLLQRKSFCRKSHRTV